MLAAHFSMPLDDLDWRNLRTGGYQVVQIPWGQALYRAHPNDQAQLRQLTAAGYRVVLRMSHGDYAGKSAAQLQEELRARQFEAGDGMIWGAIVGNEPDQIEGRGAVDLRLGSPSWEQSVAYVHAWETDQVRQAIGDRVTLIGAPLSNYFLTEDDTPKPGLMEWWMRLKGVYHGEGLAAGDRHRIAMVGVHIYEQNYDGQDWSVDTWRSKGKLWLWESLWQADLVIDEWNITRGSNVVRMRACAQFARFLARHPLGNRVRLWSPFVFNGLGNQYENTLIMRDPAAHEEFRRVLAS
jgi:hypothetical protein